MSERELDEEGSTTGVGGAAAMPEKLLRARDVVSELLSHLGVEAEVEVRDFAEEIGCRIGVRAGKEVLEALPVGQVLGAVQYLANRIVNRDAEGRKWIALHLGDFPSSEPDPAMVGMAERLGDAARRMGKRLTVVPMQARDRKTVHRVIGGVEGIQTRSEGEGNLRRLVILAKEPE